MVKFPSDPNAISTEVVANKLYSLVTIGKICISSGRSYVVFSSNTMHPIMVYFSPASVARCVETEQERILDSPLKGLCAISLSYNSNAIQSAFHTVWKLITCNEQYSTVNWSVSESLSSDVLAETGKHFRLDRRWMIKNDMYNL